MITRFDIKGFKTLVDVEVPLSPGITVLVGANNSGKTNFLRAVKLVAAMVQSPHQPFLAVGDAGGFETLVSAGHSGALSITTHGEFDDRSADYKLEADRRPGFPGWVETLRFQNAASGPLVEMSGRQMWAFQPTSGPFFDSGGNPPGGFHVLAENAAADHPVRRLWSALENARFVDFFLDSLREPSVAKKGAILGPHGAGLAAVLDALSDEQPDKFQAIVDSVKAAAPEVLRITTPSTDQEGFKTVAVQERGGAIVRAAQMSDGLLLFIGLATVIHLARSTETLLLIEEPDRGIHPRRIRQLVDQLRLLTQQGTQVVLSTHSPILLDEFRDEPESVLFFDRDDAGTHVTRLSDKPEWLKELDGGALGDIWYSGVLGGAPPR